MKVLALGAHFDDIEVGIGGTLIQYIENGNNVYIGITNSDEFRTGEPSMRWKEQCDSIKEMGLSQDRIFRFTSECDMSRIIGDLDKIEADVVYVPFWKDTHQDHVRCSRIGQAVGRKRNMDVFFYDSGSAYDFFPTLFIKIDFDKKRRLLNCFPSQINNGSVVHMKYEKRDSYIASLISDEVNIYAEGFVVRRMLYKIGGR
jgi:LmbE family N-acetylglucosaminyl deacetylase